MENRVDQLEEELLWNMDSLTTNILSFLSILHNIKENKIPETFSYHAVLSSLKHLNAFIEQHGKEISFLSSALLDELVKQKQLHQIILFETSSSLQ